MNAQTSLSHLTAEPTLPILHHLLQSQQWKKCMLANFCKTPHQFNLGVELLNLHLQGLWQGFRLQTDRGHPVAVFITYSIGSTANIFTHPQQKGRRAFH